ncbi:MAG: type II secretion system F family protein, partial [Candidatus Aenigmarchaeota archaeon]|nr:type II secretion system F family protein [Candidatus Aenigmarchaeota archaeon]
PIVIFRYLRYKETKEIEDKFPTFLIDLVEAVRAGMPLPQALKHVSKNDYGKLSYYIKKMASQMEWGIPFDEVLLRFSKQSGSKFIGRLVSTIVESHRFGGNLTDIFEGISQTSLEIERLREERKVYLQSQMTTGYVIFFVFLAVLIGMQKFLIPGLTQVGKAGEVFSGGQQITPEQLTEEYKTVFRNLIFLQAMFAGLVVGKMSEGSILAGLKHSVAMTLVGVIVYTLAT